MPVLRFLRGSIDHLRVILQETGANKRVLWELMNKWNRPIYEKPTSYRAMRAHDEPEAMEVMPPGNRSSGGRRRGMEGGMGRRDGPSRDESVGNILNARARWALFSCLFFFVAEFEADD